MNLKNYLLRRSSSLLALILFLTGSAIGQTSDRRDGMRFVPNVQSQFHDLTIRADGFGLNMHTHVFNASGTYAVDLAIADDDGGFDIESRSVQVVTPEQAVIELIAMIDTVIASTTDTRVLADLRKARHALTGSNENSHNGALKMIRSGENEAAAAFALTSAQSLQAAAQGGANVAVMIALPEQVAAALSA